jgi:hypothetical protein
MKKSIKTLLLTALVIMMVFSGTFTAFGAATSAPSAIQVLYDGQYIAFKDAVPKIVNGRTMVPFRQILEEMGMTVNYDTATKTVTASNDSLNLSFMIGGSDITIDASNDTSTKKMDVVPFVDPKTNRTYVSARFMAESLGYNVGWDSTEKTVLINNFDKLFATADEDFSVMNKLMSSDLDMEKTYHSTGSFDATINTTAGPTPVKMTMSGDVDAIQLKSNADMTMNFKVDASETVAQLPADQQAAAEPVLAMLKDMNIKMKMNGTDGIIYMNAPVFSLLDPTIDANTWLKMDFFKLYDDMGMDIRGLMDMSSSSVSIEQLLSSYTTTAAPTDVSTYKDAKAAYAFLKNLIGDEAFTKQTSSSTTTYTLKLDAAAITAALAKTALTEGGSISPSDLVDLKAGLDALDFSSNIMVKVTSDKMTAYSMSGDGAFEGSLFDFNVVGTPLTTDMTMGFTMAGIMDMTMTVNSVMEVTTESVDLTLPAGAKIVDYNALMGL